MRSLRVLAEAPRRVLIALVRAYRFWLSPWLGSRCLYLPTCSAYALQALERHGALAGSYLTLARLARCGPWCEAGHDPVPDERPKLFTRLLHPAAAPAEPASSSPDKNIP
ncbi:MAG TPA: membrane protein insertion efficiency factor YidD [Burkholderiales bacterium]|nr:membrane protein insertion efficiency factor YidD [Burkholderiales bacterium]